MNYMNYFNIFQSSKWGIVKLYLSLFSLNLRWRVELTSSISLYSLTLRERESRLGCQTFSLIQSDLVSMSVRLCYLVSQPLSDGQSDFVSVSLSVSHISSVFSVRLNKLCQSDLISQSYTFPVSKTYFVTFFTTPLYI